MTTEQKLEACKGFYDKLCEALTNTHENVASCNADISSYLIPKGSVSQLSYYGKPANSFRISDHWNWYSSLKKCSLANYIQCYSPDVPYAGKRPAPGKATRPVSAIQVSYFGADNKYHCVYGEVYNRKTKKWDWKEATVEEAVALAF